MGVPLSAGMVRARTGIREAPFGLPKRMRCCHGCNTDKPSRTFILDLCGDCFSNGVDYPSDTKEVSMSPESPEPAPVRRRVDTLKPCARCGRQMRPGALSRHEPVCLGKTPAAAAAEASPSPAIPHPTSPPLRVVAKNTTAIRPAAPTPRGRRRPTSPTLTRRSKTSAAPARPELPPRLSPAVLAAVLSDAPFIVKDLITDAVRHGMFLDVAARHTARCLEVGMGLASATAPAERKALTAAV